MPFDSIAFCTDEDIQTEIGNDFFLIAPRAQRLAIGSDGAIAAVSPWVLTSAKVNFASQQVPPGAIIKLLSKDRTSAANAEFSPSGESFVVDSVTGSTLTLRRVGLLSGVGDPVGSPDVDLSGISFESITLAPQIKTASDWIRRQVDFDSSADLVGDDDLRYLVIYRVLSKIYLSESALASTSRDVFLVKAKTYKDQAESAFDELLSRRQSNFASDDISIVPVD